MAFGPLVANRDEDPRVRARVATQEHLAAGDTTVPVEDRVGERLAEGDLEVDAAVLRATALEGDARDLRDGPIQSGTRAGQPRTHTEPQVTAGEFPPVSVRDVGPVDLLGPPQWTSP